MSNERGAGVRNTTQTTFYSVNGGKLTRRVSEKTATSVERKLTKGPNEGQIIHEEQADFITGQLLSVDKKVSEKPINGTHLKSWVFVLDTSTNGVVSRAQIELSYNSSLSTNLLKRLPNVDISKDITVAVGRGFDDIKKKDFDWITIYQSGNKVDPFFTKENPNGFPELKKVKFQGKEQWDNTDQIEFWENDFLPKFKEKLKAIHKDEAPAPAPAPENATAFESDSQQGDDLPF